MTTLSQGTPIRVRGERRYGKVTGRTYREGSYVEYIDAVHGGFYLAPREKCVIDRKAQRIAKAVRMRKAAR